MSSLGLLSSLDGSADFSVNACSAFSKALVASWRSDNLAFLSAKTSSAFFKALLKFFLDSSVYLSRSFFLPASTLVWRSSLALANSLSSLGLLSSLDGSAGFSANACSALSKALAASWRSDNLAFLSAKTSSAFFKASLKFFLDSSVNLLKSFFSPALTLAWRSSLALAKSSSSLGLVSWLRSLTSTDLILDSLPYLSTVLNCTIPFLVSLKPSTGTSLNVFPLSML